MAERVLNPKTYTITLPADQARKADILVEHEKKDMNVLVAEAIDRLYSQRFDEHMKETWAYAASRNPRKYTEEDVPRLIKEVRAEMAAENEQAAALAAKAS